MTTVPQIATAPEPKFSAVLTPHRSLGPTGFIIVMGLIGGISFISGCLFLFLGAWPVIGFLGLDVALVYWAFRVNYRSALMHETVDVTEDRVTVRRIDRKGGIREWSFQPYWLRIEMEEDEEECGPLYLSSHGSRLAVGTFLSANERRDFARALRAAITSA